MRLFPNRHNGYPALLDHLIETLSHHYDHHEPIVRRVRLWVTIQVVISFAATCILTGAVLAVGWTTTALRQAHSAFYLRKTQSAAASLFDRIASGAGLRGPRSCVEGVASEAQPLVSTTSRDMAYWNETKTILGDSASTWCGVAIGLSSS